MSRHHTLTTMGSLGKVSMKPHAVFVPFPTQGHINPLLMLAKLLHYRGFHITFANTEYNHKRLLKSRGSSTTNLDDFQFETIPDGLPPSDGDASQDLAVLNDSTRKTCLGPFRELVAKLNESASEEVPPVSCIVADGVMTFTLEVAKELDIPNVLFWTFGACGFAGFKITVELMKRGIVPFKDPSFLTDGTLDTPVDCIPGPNNLQLKHIPTFIRTTDPNDLMLDIVKSELEATSNASAVIVHTFDELEHETLDAISPYLPPIYAIGPLPLLVAQIPDKTLQSLDYNLWKPDNECIEWLNSKQEGSVVYVNFGSIAVLSPNEILELAFGLADSKKNFLWIIRPDLLVGKSGLLTNEFFDETKDRGLIISWCPQENVLNHPSVGAFLTHCGWNSTIEGIAAGVPFLCFPCLSEQPMNAKFVCDDWGFGIEIGKKSGRDEIANVVKKLMDGENGKVMKKRAKEWKAKALEATTSPNGSSVVNLENVVKILLGKSNILE
uniref:UDP-glycosyltransferase n=1 Tax=Scoparia dulcis TaxID=107240 RepID=A0A5H2Q861_SCODU|nr:UDP-glycosyltransferase [Scoparia dulcis]